MLNYRDVSDLEWALGVGATRFQRSTFGAQLDAAQNARWGADGRAIRVTWDRWTTMTVRHQHAPASYTPDDRELERFARVSRRLLAVSRTDALAHRVLELYYGDSGARWSHQQGVGQVAAIYPLTATGRALARQLRSARSGGGGPDMRDDELIASDVTVQIVNRNELRAKRHEKMRREADELLVRAARAWVAAAAVGAAS